jgi:L-fuculose-phosphate aldolase
MNEREAKEKVVNAGIRLVQSGLIARTWGNVSCRISESQFVITPSGRDYLTLTPEDIVTVSIADLSYEGTIKPSGEKAVHAQIYQQRPSVNFVIHTHQEIASVISAMGIDSIPVDSNYPLLGEEVVCASYGLPGTKKLRRGVAKALDRSKGNAIIMRKHGALMFGKDEEEAFQVASDLEQVCIIEIAAQYRKIKHVNSYDPKKLRQFAIEQLSRKKPKNSYECIHTYYYSERTEDGFLLQAKNKESIPVKLGQLSFLLPKEAELHHDIYLQNKNINYILQTDSPNIIAMSRVNRSLYPMVDDFAQIVGCKVKTLSKNQTKIGKNLKKASAVMLLEHGALCCGATKGDAIAVQMILEKNCKARICSTMYKSAKPISRLDSKLMRVVYLKKYSKQMNNNSKC